MRRPQGFTLIELLVVIAIIAILAAMLFPVFARARESARKIQCLSNVKNIAMAWQMYFSDYDRYPPTEHRTEVIDWFNTTMGCDDSTTANPYLRVPVILEEYIKNRDVWRCPSAKLELGANWIRPTTPDWFTWTKLHYNTSVCCSGFCQDNYPPGWGGSVTDTSVQGAATVVGSRTEIEGAFVQGIDTLDYNYRDKKLSTFQDPAKQVVCMDGAMLQWGKILHDAYPDICRIDRIGTTGCHADWVNCPWTLPCSALSIGWFFDVNLRKGSARHMGGLNVGFMDGHAQWVNSEALIAGAEKPNHPDWPAQYYGLANCRDPQDPACTCTFLKRP